MSIHLKNASIGFGLSMELLSKIASTDITIRTKANYDYIDKILEGTVGFKSKNDLHQFQNNGMMYFFPDNNNILHVRFVGEYNEKDIRTFVNGINYEYNKIAYHSKNNNNQSLKSQEEKKIKLEKKRIQKMEEERLNIEKQLKQKKMKEYNEFQRKNNTLQSEIKFEEEKLQKINNRISSDFLEESKKLKEIQREKELLEKEFLKENESKSKELLEEEIKLKEKELELKEKYENNNFYDNIDDDLIVVEDNSNSIIISSNLTDKTIIDSVLSESYLGFSSRKELEEFQNIGSIKINRNSAGTYDFIFAGEYDESRAKKYVEDITDEYALEIQERTYLKVLEKIKEKDMSLESEIIDKENSIVLTINI
ncbi:hypothetical protein PXD04_08170 [Methanosphaera sp. ISO3-F5]|uniref:hypothetical protein n=1 Tax=Methanosphaera sp. ISO3-F5 TaxID=1452353 RepID=UPI002B25B793|nr:hypothetical protein [Methanosphaera sp. ISO3-F5]WQH63668.1 hypothetical protein PXD04_08170 [Methanosphaera sp. ISO3-F5]